MAEFVTQYVETTIASAGSSASLVGGTDFVSVADVTKTIVLPASSQHDNAGMGYVSGTSTATQRDHRISADLTATNALTFARGGTPAEVVRCGVNLLEYTGPSGGPNEILRRHKQTITLPGATATTDTSSISGIVDITRCFAVAFCSSDVNNTTLSVVAVRVDLINTGGVFTARLTRAQTTNAVTAVVYVYECTGTNWTVQKISHTMSAADTAETAAVVGATVANSFIIRTFSTTGTSTPATGTVYVWLSNATTLNFRAEGINSTNVIAFVLTNPKLNVQQLSLPDGTADYPDTTDVQVETFSFTTVAPERALVIGQAGSDDATNANHPADLWGFRLTSSAAGDARRFKSIGTSERVVQIVEFPLGSVTLSSTGTLRSGASGHLFGSGFLPGATNPTVTMDGASQTVTGSTDTDCTFTVAIGTQKFGTAKVLALTSSISNTDSITATVLPPSAQQYFDLSGGLAENGVLEAIPDLSSTAQLWAKSLLDSGAGVIDVTNAALFQILPNGVIELDQSVSVPATVQVAANNGNGAGWGSFATITIAATSTAPVVVPVPDFILIRGVATQINVAQYATGATTVAIQTGVLPTGMTNANGIISGTPTVLGDFPVTIRYSNASGNTDEDVIFTVVRLSALGPKFGLCGYNGFRVRV